MMTLDSGVRGCSIAHALTFDEQEINERRDSRDEGEDGWDGYDFQFVGQECQDEDNGCELSREVRQPYRLLNTRVRTAKTQGLKVSTVRMEK
jgi:hypothetical protein